MNSTKISTALILIATLAAACGPNPGGETAGNYLDDAAITTKVKAAISLNSHLASGVAGVKVSSQQSDRKAARRSREIVNPARKG